MIYKTIREVFIALLEGKILKTVKPVYDIYRDKSIIKYYKMNESEILEYDMIESVWYSSLPRLLGNIEFEEVKDIIKTVSINELEFPRPVKEQLESGTDYYIPHIGSSSESWDCKWTNHTVDLYRLENNLVQLTKEGAEAQKLAMLSILKEVVNKK